MFRRRRDRVDRNDGTGDDGPPQKVYGFKFGPADGAGLVSDDWFLRIATMLVATIPFAPMYLVRGHHLRFVGIAPPILFLGAMATVYFPRAGRYVIGLGILVGVFQAAHFLIADHPSMTPTAITRGNVLFGLHLMLLLVLAALLFHPARRMDRSLRKP